MCVCETLRVNCLINESVSGIVWLIKGTGIRVLSPLNRQAKLVNWYKALELNRQIHYQGVLVAQR